MLGRFVSARPDKMRQLGFSRDNLAEVITRHRAADTIAEADPVEDGSAAQNFCSRLLKPGLIGIGYAH